MRSETALARLAAAAFATILRRFSSAIPAASSEARASCSGEGFATLRAGSCGSLGGSGRGPTTKRSRAGARFPSESRIRSSSCASSNAQADELGLPELRLSYEGEPPTFEALDARLERDLERGTTGLGPHLHDVQLLSSKRDLRLYGSQGEQRLTVLALLLAEAELIADRRGVAPLLLLDDVLSELDPDRRRALAGRVSQAGQTLVTSTTATALPVEPAQLLRVSPGEVVPAS